MRRAGTGLGAYYRPLPESFELRDGVTVRIFERTGEVPPEVLDVLSARLLEAYPDYREAYARPGA